MDLDFDDRNVNQSFGKTINTFLTNLNWPIFSARTFLSGELAILKSGIFRIQIFLFGFSSLELQTSFEFVNAKVLTNVISKTAAQLVVQILRNMNHESYVFFIPFVPSTSGGEIWLPLS